MRGGWALALALVVGAGCGSKEVEPAKLTKAVEPALEAAPIPETEAAFLAELMPLPASPDGREVEAIEIRYAITGPGLEGEMTIALRAGGLRRERWELRTVGEGPELKSTGVTVVGLEQISTGPEGEPGEVRASPLGPVARGWAKLDADERAAVVRAVRERHAVLDERRKANPGDQGEVLGVGCLRTRIAAQNLCMWEQLGVFLRYEGSAFAIEATEVVFGAEFEDVGGGVAVAGGEGGRSRPKTTQDRRRAKPAGGEALEEEVVAALSEAVKGDAGGVLLLVGQARGLPRFSWPARQ
jgi:hypothetical protein